MSKPVDAGRQRKPEKREGRRRLVFPRNHSWAYGEQSYDCHLAVRWDGGLLFAMIIELTSNPCRLF